MIQLSEMVEKLINKQIICDFITELRNWGFFLILFIVSQIFLLLSLSLLFYFSLVQEHLYFPHCSPMQYCNLPPQDYLSITQAHTLFTTWRANRHKPSFILSYESQKMYASAKSNKVHNYYYVWIEHLKPLFFFRTSILRIPRSPPSSFTHISFYKIKLNI